MWCKSGDIHLLLRLQAPGADLTDSRARAHADFSAHTNAAADTTTTGAYTTVGVRCMQEPLPGLLQCESRRGDNQPVLGHPSVQRVQV